LENLALPSTASGGHSVGIVSFRTKATEFIFSFYIYEKTFAVMATIALKYRNSLQPESYA
jgi:hypothetical protein